MKRERFLAIVLMALCPVLAFGQTAEQSPFGVVAAPGIANDTCRQDDLSNLGVGWVRVAFPWGHVERGSKGNFFWDEPDRLLADMNARGIYVFWDFSYAACWANGRPCQPDGTTAEADQSYPPLNQQNLRDYVTAVVTRYKGFGYRNVYWGTWNEPNLTQFYKGGGNGQTNITRFVANELPTTVNAIRAADPEAKIVVGELSSSGGYSTVFGYLRQMLNAVAGKFDVISQHMYDGGDTCSGRLSGLDTLRSSLNTWGYGNFPVWVTETGLNASEATKNSYLQCFWNGLRSASRSLWWKGIYWYRFETDASWGLLNGGPAPCTYTTNTTYDTYRSLISTWPARPAAPGLTATPGNNQVTLTWTAVTGALGYNVYRGTRSGGPYKLVRMGASGTQYVDSGLTNGVTYYFVVSATGTAGDGPYSVQRSATPQATPPATPTGLGAGPADRAVNLAWQPASGATSYNVKRSTTNGGPYSTIATGVATTTYTNTGLTNGTTYYYVVSAVSSGGQSGNSAQASATPRRLAGANVVANPSFETGTGADAASWTEGASHARSSDRRALGSWSLRSTFRGAGTATIATTAAAVASNTEYELSAWIFKAGTGAGCVDLNDIPGETQLCAGPTNQWVFVSGPWYSGSTTGVRLRAVTDGSPGADIWFDMIQLAPSNLVPNPSFETAGATSGDASLWTEGTSHARASDRAHDGAWSLKSTYTGAGTASSTGSIAVAANTTYRLSVWVYKAATTGAACIDMNDRAGELQLCATQTNQWQLLTGTWPSGSAPPPVVLRLVTDGNPNGSVWFDQVVFKPE